MNYFVIQLHDLKMLPVVFSLTAASRNEPVSGSVYCPFSIIPTSELLRATAHNYDFVFPCKLMQFIFLAAQKNISVH